MRLLLLTASLPYPPHQGGALRSYGIVHGLSQAGHDVTLLSFHDSNSSIAASDTPLARYCSRIETVPPPSRSRGERLRDLFLSRQPDITRRLYSPAFWECLQKLVKETAFDIIQFEGIEVACYLPLLRQTGSSARLVYDAFNAEAALQWNIFEVDRGDLRRLPAAAYSLIQSRRIARFERDLCQAADCVIAVSDEDAEILRQYRPDRDVPVVTNGIFVDDYARSSEQLDLGEHALVFTGKMDYRPNVDAMTWFAADILPLVQERLPDTRLYIVGQKPHPRLETLRHKNYIEITGWVQDVQPYLHSAAVYVAPLRMGSGTRLKLLEAMASGCAIVATSIAISGMRPEARRVMAVTDDARDIAKAILNLLENPSRRQELGSQARAYVKRHYDWPVLIPGLLHIYKGLGVG